MLERLPDLLLAGMVAVDCERHELVEREPVLGIDVEQPRRYRSKAQALLHHRDRHEESDGDLLLGPALLAQCHEAAELVEGMQRRALNILGERVLFGDAALAHYAGDRRGFGEPLLLHQQLQRPVAPATCRDLVHAGLGAFGIAHRADGQALEKRAPGDVVGQLLD